MQLSSEHKYEPETAGSGYVVDAGHETHNQNLTCVSAKLSVPHEHIKAKLKNSPYGLTMFVCVPL